MKWVIAMSNIRVRTAKSEDLTAILSVYKSAREYMKRTGNPTQWGDWYPPISYLEEDIKLERLFVLECDGEIVGAFMFFIGIDPNYAIIENGKWTFDIEYGVIHRVASNGKVRGLFKAVFDFALSKTDYLRIDTHRDNLVMQSVLKKFGFNKCGIVYMLDDGTPRIAFDYKK